MQVVIIGLGLIGGSIGLALKQQGKPTREVVGYVRRPEVATAALEMGAIDRAETSLEATVKEADIVVICTPVLTIKEILSRIADHLPDGCIVSDAASTKFQVMQWAHEILPPSATFIGGHPMAGKELYGIEAAEAGLFRGCTYCLTPERKTPSEALDKVINMVEIMGAVPLLVDAREHDDLVAGISHLPLLLSAALVSSTAKDPSWQRMSRLAASGYRDLSRLASGNPQVNADICLSNSQALLRWVDKFKRELDNYRQMVEDGDENLLKTLAGAKRARQKWLNEAK
ncbi:MAG: prephenate dehydrogenase [Dehalococcoidia bacterium]|nr:prephenate dehydrogenase [Dehalococcoidia bacterium]